MNNAPSRQTEYASVREAAQAPAIIQEQAQGKQNLSLMMGIVRLSVNPQANAMTISAQQQTRAQTREPALPRA